MKYAVLLLIPLCTFVYSAQAAPKRFKITNEVSGLSFQVERDDGLLGEMQPEWGVGERELPCDEVPEAEKTRVLSRREGGNAATGVREWCLVKTQFTLVEEDITAERTEKDRKIKAKKDRDELLKALQAKAKAGTLNTADRNEIVRLLILDRFPELD